MNLKNINIEKVKKISYWTFLGFLLAALIFVLFPLLPIKNNYSLRMVTSGSMRPTIKTGAVVMVKPVPSYKVRDIITFQNGSGEKDVVTHRIISRQGDEFITQGDANNVADVKPVREEQILGKVVFNIPYAGYVANFARSKVGFILFILILAVFIILDQTKKIVGEVKKIKKKNVKDKS